MARQKMQPTEKTVRECLDEATSDIHGLHEEMQEWADNTEEYFSETEKYQRVTEAAEALESGHSEIEGWDGPVEVLEKFNPDMMQTKIKVYQFRWGKRGLARWRRLSNAICCLDCAKEFLDDASEKAEQAEDVIPDEVTNSLEEISEKIEQCKDYVDSVEFLTMFG